MGVVTTPSIKFWGASRPEPIILKKIAHYSFWNFPKFSPMILLILSYYSHFILTNASLIMHALIQTDRQLIMHALIQTDRQLIMHALIQTDRQTINYACTHSNRQTIVVELINNAGKAHSTLWGPEHAPPPGNFENLHCLRLILRQSGSYVKYCWLKFLAYDFANIMSPCTDRLFPQ